MLLVIKKKMTLDLTNQNQLFLKITTFVTLLKKKLCKREKLWKNCIVR